MNFRSAQLRSAISRYDPDLLFLFRLGFRSWAFAEARTKFSWWVEADERVDEALREVPQFDHYFFINSSSVEVARHAGYSHTSYLAHAVDASVFRPLADVRRISIFLCRIVVEKRQRFIDAALDVSENGVVYGLSGTERLSTTAASGAL